MARKGKYLPKKFETLRKAQKDSRRNIKRLRHDGEKESICLADVLEECVEEVIACNSPACRVCSRARRVWLLPAVIKLLKGLKNDDWVLVTLIFYSDAMSSKEFSSFDVRILKNRLIKQLKRIGVAGPVIGGFEIDYHTENGKWLPHFHLLMPKQDKPLEELRRYMKRRKNMSLRLETTHRPMKVDALKDYAEQVSYCFKYYWCRIESYLSKKARRRETIKGRLRNKHLALALRKKDEFGFSGLLFIYGARIAGQRVIVSGK